MKKLSCYGVALGLALAVSGNAWSYTIQDSSVDVGEIDNFLAETGAVPGDNNGDLPGSGSSPENELAWAGGILGMDLTGAGYDVESTVQYYSVDGLVNTFAFALSSGPGYYIIKNANNWALFENVSSFDWGVIDLADLNLSRWNIRSQEDLSEMTISHVTGFSTSVPEPGSLALLAAGLAGLVCTRRFAR